MHFKDATRSDKDTVSELANAHEKLNRELIELLVLEAPLGERLSIKGCLFQFASCFTVIPTKQATVRLITAVNLLNERLIKSWLVQCVGYSA
jgi:hypothetical protein